VKSWSRELPNEKGVRTSYRYEEVSAELISDRFLDSSSEHLVNSTANEPVDGAAQLRPPSNSPSDLRVHEFNVG